MSEEQNQETRAHIIMRSGVMRVRRRSDGTWCDIPALRGTKGDPGSPGVTPKIARDVLAVKVPATAEPTASFSEIDPAAHLYQLTLRIPEGAKGERGDQGPAIRMTQTPINRQDPVADSNGEPILDDDGNPVTILVTGVHCSFVDEAGQVIQEFDVYNGREGTVQFERLSAAQKELLKGPPGENGASGVTPVLKAGTVTMAEPSSMPVVTLTQEAGAEVPTYVINLTIPRGYAGAPGAQGTDLTVAAVEDYPPTGEHPQGGKQLTFSDGTTLVLYNGAVQFSDLTAEERELIRGPQGEQGEPARVSVSGVDTLDPESDATVTASYNPQTNVTTLHLGIPRGARGASAQPFYTVRLPVDPPTSATSGTVPFTIQMDHQDWFVARTLQAYSSATAEEKAHMDKIGPVIGATNVTARSVAKVTETAKMWPAGSLVVDGELRWKKNADGTYSQVTLQVTNAAHSAIVNEEYDGIPLYGYGQSLNLRSWTSYASTLATYKSSVFGNSKVATAFDLGIRYFDDTSMEPVGVSLVMFANEFSRLGLPYLELKFAIVACPTTSYFLATSSLTNYRLCNVLTPDGSADHLMIANGVSSRTISGNTVLYPEIIVPRADVPQGPLSALIGCTSGENICMTWRSDDQTTVRSIDSLVDTTPTEGNTHTLVTSDGVAQALKMLRQQLAAAGVNLPEQ